MHKTHRFCTDQAPHRAKQGHKVLHLIPGAILASQFLYNNPHLNHQSAMEVYMRMYVSSSNSVMLIRLKWRMKRGVTELRPPPGGPMAAMNCMSSSLRKVLSERSYQPP